MSDRTPAQKAYDNAAAAYSKAWDDRTDVPRAVFMVAQAVHHQVAELREQLSGLELIVNTHGRSIVRLETPKTANEPTPTVTIPRSLVERLKPAHQSHDWTELTALIASIAAWLETS